MISTRNQMTLPAALGALAAGCSASASETPDPPAADELSPVLLLGDSVAAGQALPLGEAFAASGVRFQSLASDGGGNVVGPFSEEQWETLPGEIAAAEPAVVVYQITTYDYRPHLPDLERTADVADASGGRAVLLDAGEVWGDAYQRTRDGSADRSTDGIHTCPQGAARFAHWLLGELAERHPGFTPAPGEGWANTGWAGDERFAGC